MQMPKKKHYYDPCAHCLWSTCDKNGKNRKCEKPKGEGYCHYTKSNV